MPDSKKPTLYQKISNRLRDRRLDKLDRDIDRRLNRIRTRQNNSINQRTVGSDIKRLEVLSGRLRSFARENGQITTNNPRYNGANQRAATPRLTREQDARIQGMNKALEQIKQQIDNNQRDLDYQMSNGSLDTKNSLPSSSSQKLDLSDFLKTRQAVTTSPKDDRNSLDSLSSHKSTKKPTVNKNSRRTPKF